MLTGICLKNFKCFEEIKIKDLKDITLLTGVNNAGKSTIFQAIVFLKESISRCQIAWDIPELHLHDFKETVYKHDINRLMEISCIFELSDSEKKRFKPFKIHLKEIKYSVTINKDNLIEKEIISTSDDKEILVVRTEKVEKDVRHGSIHRILLRNLTHICSAFAKKSHTEVGWTQFNETSPLHWKIAESEETEDVAQYFNTLNDILCEKFKSFIFYLSPDRKIPEWDSGISTKPTDVGFRGQNTTIQLHYIFSDRDRVFDRIEDWVKQFDPEIQLLRSPLKEGRTVIELRTILGDINIMTSGCGLNTVIPIIVQCLTAPEESTILIEEPEIHLHPGAQKVMLDMFKQMSDEKKQIIFTTHSYDILLDYYKRVKEQKIDESDISCKLIKRWKDGSRTCENMKLYCRNFNEWRDKVGDLAKRP